MKLHEYIFKKFMDMSDPVTMSDYFTEEDIEKWIVDWYSATFKAVGCDGTKEEDRRLPPMWLANWRKVWEREQKK
jgi:hypothetical protein